MFHVKSNGSIEWINDQENAQHEKMVLSSNGKYLYVTGVTNSIVVMGKTKVITFDENKPTTYVQKVQSIDGRIMGGFNNENPFDTNLPHGIPPVPIDIHSHNNGQEDDETVTLVGNMEHKISFFGHLTDESTVNNYFIYRFLDNTTCDENSCTAGTCESVFGANYCQCPTGFNSPFDLNSCSHRGDDYYSHSCQTGCALAKTLKTLPPALTTTLVQNTNHAIDTFAASNCACGSNPCLNSAACVETNDNPDGYYCLCGPDQSSNDFCRSNGCNVLKDSNGDSLCLNGGSCVVDTALIPAPFNARCLCDGPYEGRFCQFHVVL